MSSSDRKYRRSPRAPLLTPQKYDDHEFSFGGASFSGAVFNLSTTVVGAGIMALPAAVKQLGLVPGMVMIVLGAILTGSSVDMILRLTRASKLATYSALVGDAFGRAGRTFLQVAIVINNLGMLVVYMIIIGTELAFLFYICIYAVYTPRSLVNRFVYILFLATFVEFSC